jgi:transcriptional regulator with XRE-family HTH domain
MLGDELRAARLAAGWSQEELADRAGISRNYVSLLERNEKSPTVDVLLAVCHALGASAADLLRRVEEETPPRRRRRRRASG